MRTIQAHLGELGELGEAQAYKPRAEHPILSDGHT